MGAALWSRAFQLSVRRLVASSLLRRDPQALLDVGDLTLVRIEELVRDLGPTAELVDREEGRRRRVLRLVHQARYDGPIALLGKDLLPFGGACEVDERLRFGGVLAV